MTRKLSALAVVAALVAISASARVISYSPYSDRTTYPAQQARANRYFVLLEGTPPVVSPIMSPIPAFGFPGGQVVLYDSAGAEEPRVILPQDGVSYATVSSIAVRESNGTPVILVETNDDVNKANPNHALIWVLSTDGGKTWKTVNLPGSQLTNLAAWMPDIGGPEAKSRYSQIRLGNAGTPFVLSLTTYSTAAPVTTTQTIYAVNADGTVKTLASSTGTTYLTLAGSDKDGTKFLVRGPADTLSILDLSGNMTTFAKIDQSDYQVEGWITPDGDVYLDERTGQQVKFSRLSKGTQTFAMFQPVSTDAYGIFGIPTADYSGAWIIQRGPGKPTTLTLHNASGPKEQWSDVTAPEVEALHAAKSGSTLLVQVHRNRPQIDQRLFKDPALAFWKVGDPAPRDYDELFMNEQTTKAFVHLDVDAAQLGAPFVFDSGAIYSGGGIIISPSVPPSAGGSDVIQEWGTVRASFKQQLVLPGIGRTPGAYGSNWSSDVIIYNPTDGVQKVAAQFIPNGASSTACMLASPPLPWCQTITLTLQPQEIRVVKDVLKTVFATDSGNGALFLFPESGINATSRTFTTDTKGTYGFGMNAIDWYGGAASPRFPVSFSGAFPGPNFRTNMVLTDVSGRGTTVAASALGFLGTMGTDGVKFSAPSGGTQQVNGISSPMGITSSDYGALSIQPTAGEAIASVFTIDNRTNDPTYFPPDLPAPIVRTIPAIGHLDGANNSKYRSDLYIYNPSDQTRTLTLQMKMWDSATTQTLNLTLLGREARVIPDVLMKLFGKEGIARLRYQSVGDSNGIRVTSRTYSIDDNGGTYGFLMPPLNNFQAAASGDTLEILGVVGGTGFRTNIGLVDLTSFATTSNPTVKVEIIDNAGKTIDSFTVNVPSAGGMQLNDIFHARGLGNGPAAALIRISPNGGLIGAYATINDNGTNDPTYLAANLGARQ